MPCLGFFFTQTTKRYILKRSHTLFWAVKLSTSMFVYYFAVYRACYVFLCLTTLARCWVWLSLFYAERNWSSGWSGSWPRDTKCQGQDFSQIFESRAVSLHSCLTAAVGRWMLNAQCLTSILTNPFMRRPLASYYITSPLPHGSTLQPGLL